MVMIGVIVMGISLFVLFTLLLVWVQLFYLKIKEKEQTE